LPESRKPFHLGFFLGLRGLRNIQQQKVPYSVRDEAHAVWLYFHLQIARVTRMGSCLHDPAPGCAPATILGSEALIMLSRTRQ
jgi:hypothetical protein